MSTEENKAIARQIQEELWDQKNLAVADELLAPTYVDHVAVSPPEVPPGPARHKEIASAYFTAGGVVFSPKRCQISAPRTYSPWDQVTSFSVRSADSM